MRFAQVERPGHDRVARCFRPVLHMRIFFLKARPVFLPHMLPKLCRFAPLATARPVPPISPYAPICRANLTFLLKYVIIKQKDFFYRPVLAPLRMPKIFGQSSPIDKEEISILKKTIFFSNSKETCRCRCLLFRLTYMPP